MAAQVVLGYLLKEGVRRSVAARDAGWVDLPAVIVEDGKADVSPRLPLTVLFTTKDEVPRDHRYIRWVEYPTRVLGTQPPPLKVEAITDARLLKYLTPIARVRLT